MTSALVVPVSGYMHLFQVGEPSQFDVAVHAATRLLTACAPETRFDLRSQPVMFT